MRLAISNLAWPSALDEVVFERLARLGVSGVEVAPTRLGAWDTLSHSLLADYRARIEAAGLVVSSLQAVLFGRPEFQLLGKGAPFEELREHMRNVAEIGAMLGAGVLVFGAPRNRLLGGMELESAWQCARERLHALGEITFPAGVTIGIEPVPAAYGGEFLTSWSDVLRMVTDVNHPGVRVHLDTGCVALGGGLIDEAIMASQGMLTHFHAAQPQLGDFADPLPNHGPAAAALHDVGYNRWISIEMREQQEEPLREAERAVRVVREIYGF